MKLKGRIVGIDYGTKRIGMAVTDPLQLFASPVGTFGREELSLKLRSLLGGEQVECIVVGSPVSQDGSGNAMTEVVDRFVLELKKEFPMVPVERIDESSSSREASRILAASGKSRRTRQQKGRLDSAAACVLLTRFLEERGR
ncbi:Holliday junction resolvase RuvX [Chlorobium sp. N1]|uniref:Holliday junction resolvase RuvX n=1 Tax=Chlorobium sp. N1 TaxID=2491138 RepID=UPI00103C1F8E|nr:Holliday junction resolvase RuvX [Chlorobium sp. N1]TCD48121.1 Holliday junction resolvase RuvX [Chlorobium sp. N1]